jgi:hypothetical protein
MPEPTTSAAAGYAVSIGTVTLTGAFLGLQYDLLLAGIFGGCVALSFTRQTPLLRMAITLITSAGSGIRRPGGYGVGRAILVL